MKTYLEASQMCTSSGVVKHPRVVIEDGMFAQVGSREDFEFPAGSTVSNFDGATLAPGYIDIHIHGGGGHDVMEATSEAMLSVERSMAKHGVTSYLATTVTAPVPATLESLKRLGDWIDSLNKVRKVARFPSACTSKVRLSVMRNAECIRLRTSSRHRSIYSNKCLMPRAARCGS